MPLTYNVHLNQDQLIAIRVIRNRERARKRLRKGEIEGPLPELAVAGTKALINKGYAIMLQGSKNNTIYSLTIRGTALINEIDREAAKAFFESEEAKATV